MIRFVSKMFEGMLVEGAVSMRVERKFRLFQNFDLRIFKEDKLLLAISTRLHFLDLAFEIKQNATGYTISIQGKRRTMQIDRQLFELRVNGLYPFQKKYGDVQVDGKKLGELVFEKKWFGVVLHFIPENDIVLDEQLASKVAVFTLVYIADLDGSS